MTSNEFVNRLRGLLTQQPFAPFRVELVNGESFVIDRRDAVGHNGTYLYAGFLDEAGRPYFFDPRNVVGLTPLAPVATAG